MGGRGNVGTQGCGDSGMWGLRDVGTQGCGDAGMPRDCDAGTSRSGMQDRGLGEVRNKRNHFLLRINIKYNFQRIKGCLLSEGPSEHRQTTLWLCGVFTVGT